MNLLFRLFMFLLRTKPHYPEAKADRPNAEQDDTELHHIATAIIAFTEQTKAENRRRDEQERKRLDIDGRRFRIEKSVLGLLLFGASLNIVTLYYVGKSARAAEDSADAAKASVAGSAQAMRLDQRAWVTIRTAILARPLTLGQPILVSVEAVNSGRTPARDVLADGTVVTRRVLARADMEDQSSAQGSFPFSRMLIGPSVTVTLPLDSSSPIAMQTQIDAFVHGPWVLFAKGIIHYMDIFDRPHKTHFCFKLAGADLSLAQQPNGGWTMSACEYGNTAD